MQRAEKKLGLVTKIPQSGYKSSTKSRSKDNYSNNTGITKEKIENLVKDIMASSQSQPVSQTISSKSQENQITLSQDEFKKIIAGLSGEEYDYDPVEDLRLQFEQLDINQAKLARIIHAVLKSSRKCSKCDKTGHNSCNCPK